MGRLTTAIFHFNRGIISRLALARVDLKRIAFCAETMLNWIPRVLGSMMLRPGFRFLGVAPSRPKYLPFVFSATDTALVELTHLAMRVWIGDALLSRPATSTVVANGVFAGDIVGWDDLDEGGGAASTWVAPSYMQLLGDGANAAIRQQAVPLALADIGKECGIRVVVARGPVTFRIGSTSGGDEYVSETDLATGNHSLSFVPTGTFYVRVSSRLKRVVWIDSITTEPSGAVLLPAPWKTDDLRLIRWDQSADVLFVACKGFAQYRIERRGTGRSWSVAGYYADNGPFRAENLGPITLTPSGLSGNITITSANASSVAVPYFKATNVGSLFSISSVGQRVSSSISAANTFTNTIRITGVGESRRYTWSISGTWSGTVTLQRSVGVVGFWEDVADRTSNSSDSDNDGQDNQVIFYRLGFKAGNYVSGTAVCTITYTTGSIRGVARVTGFTSSSIVDAEVLTEMGGLDASNVWSEGAWSERRGWPSAVCLYEGRLWWGGKNNIWGSITDAYDSFDPDFLGDAGPINRTIGAGPVDNINFLLPLQRMIVGSAGAELSVRSTTFDEPLSPTNFNLKEASTQGSAPVLAVKHDSRGIFVQRSGERVYELAFDSQAYDYGSTDLTKLIPELGRPGIVAIAIQRQPDTRIHCVKSDGSVAIAVIDPTEEARVISWQIITTDGAIEDVVVLPGVGEDSVYYAVNRTIGSTGVSGLVVTAGTGYTSVPTLTFAGGGGSNAAATVSLGVVSFSIGAAGSNYKGLLDGDVVTLVGGTFTIPAKIQVNTVDGSGSVLTATVIQAGSYSVLPANPIATTGGIGTGFTVNATWGLSTASITQKGGGYFSAPAVTVVGGGGSGGAVVATIESISSVTGHYLEKWAQETECQGGPLNCQADSFVAYIGPTQISAGGFVSALTVTPGAGYLTPPTLVFTGGDGAGATATVGLALAIVQSTFQSFGAGYSPGDILTALGGTSARPFKLRVDTVQTGGEILAYTIIDGGNYSVIPTISGTSPLTFTGGTGSSFIITAASFGLSEATITAAGTGYTIPPIVTVVGGGGSGASVLASVTSGSSSGTGTTQLLVGLDHLEGKEVVVWADSTDLSPDVDGVQRTYTVSSGQVVLDAPVSNAVVGLPYTGTWVSAKLAFQLGADTVLAQRKKVNKLGFIMVSTHVKGLKFGSAPDVLDELPEIEAGAPVTELLGGGEVWGGYDADTIEFPGAWSTDSRIYLYAQAPRPVTLLAAVLEIEEVTKA